MKKFMMAVVIAALAFGAQATTYQYSLQFELKNIPAQENGRPDHNLFFLVDKSADGNNTVLMWLHRDELNKSETTSTWSLTVEGKTHGTDKPNYAAFETYNNFATHTLSSATITKTGEGVSDRTIQITFTTETDILEGNIAWTDDEHDMGKTSGLWVIATKSDQPGDCLEYKVDDVINVTKTDEIGNGINLAAFAGYTNVPEPTSAMLLLLGFAGLALKRKVA